MRSDLVLGLLGLTPNDLELFVKSTGDPAAIGSVEGARASLERWIGESSGIAPGFDRVSGRTCESCTILQLTNVNPS